MVTHNFLLKICSTLPYRNSIPFAFFRSKQLLKNRQKLFDSYAQAKQFACLVAPCGPQLFPFVNSRKSRRPRLLASLVRPAHCKRKPPEVTAVFIYLQYIMWSGIIFSPPLKNFHDPASHVLLASKTLLRLALVLKNTEQSVFFIKCAQ